MNNTMKDAIYDAVAGFTNLQGVWENQRDVQKLPEPSFSLKLLNPGSPQGRIGGCSHEVEGERQAFTTRLNASLQVEVFGDHPTLAAMNNSRKFHWTLNAGGVVSHGLIASFDASQLFAEWTSVQVYDFAISYAVTAVAQDEYETDEYIEKVTINDKRIPHWDDPEPEP